MLQVSLSLLLLLHIGFTLAQQGTFTQPGYQQGQQYYSPQQPQQPQPQQFQQPAKPNPYAAPATGFLHNQALDGTYNFAYQTKDGQTRAETTGTDGAIRGSYFYTSPEGQPVKVSYTADKNGFHADSDAIPKAPIASAPVAPAAPDYAVQQQQYAAALQQQQQYAAAVQQQQQYSAAAQPQYAAPQQQQHQYEPQQQQYQYAEPQQQAQYPQYASAAAQPQYAAEKRPPPLANTPIAQYSFGDPSVLSNLQNLFKG